MPPATLLSRRQDGHLADMRSTAVTVQALATSADEITRRLPTLIPLAMPRSRRLLAHRMICCMLRHGSARASTARAIKGGDRGQVPGRLLQIHAASTIGGIRRSLVEQAHRRAPTCLGLLQAGIPRLLHVRNSMSLVLRSLKSTTYQESPSTSGGILSTLKPWLC